MKRFHTILAALTLLAAMNLTSCEKDTGYVSPYDESFYTGEKPVEYYFRFKELPEYCGDGEEYVLALDFESNLPSEAIKIESNDWISGRVSGSQILATFSRNETNDYRNGTIAVRDANGSKAFDMVPVKQPWVLTNAEGCVQFKDHGFKAYARQIADTDKDGEISMEEAAAVKVIDAQKKGIRDLSGIENFVNVEKLDLGYNDIVDATAIHNLHYLHWLNLKGNMHLRTFDVRGCSMYFERCDFEVTDSLEYYVYWRMINIEDPDDTPYAHSHHFKDPRRTEDWSREGEIRKVYEHTKGSGNLAVVFSGIGWIDIDINDGTFDRIINEAMTLLKEKEGAWKENWDYLDVYVMYHMAEIHGQWMFWDDYYDNFEEHKEEIYAQRIPYNEHRIALWEKMENSVDNRYCYKICVDNHTNIWTSFASFFSDDWVHITPNGVPDIKDNENTHNSAMPSLSEIIESMYTDGMMQNINVMFPGWKN